MSVTSLARVLHHIEGVGCLAFASAAIAAPGGKNPAAEWTLVRPA